jgi:hypothetical protein
MNSGMCRNPGCVRLATRVVFMPGVGEREMCYLCEQALTSMGMDIRRRDEQTKRAWQRTPVPA